MAIYPDAIPTIAQVFEYTDDVHWMNAAKWTVMRNELIAALTELGTNPKGSFADVKARLDDMLPHFHDRGDAATADYLKGDFITDGTWREKDLSGIVPAGAKAVLLRVFITDDVVGSYFQFRKKGNIAVWNSGMFRTQVANVFFEGLMIAVCDEDRIVEYRASNVAFSLIAVTICGWWK